MSPAERRYAKDKPFAAEIKQLLDLRYNTNLPDALGRYALTPFDSLPRTALQEWNDEAKGQRTITIDDVRALVQKSVFSVMTSGMFIESFGVLHLADVCEVRRTDAWLSYIEAVRDLLDDPFSFCRPNAGAAAVQERFVDLVGVVTRIAQRANRVPRLEPWRPVTELELDMAGGVVRIQGTPHGVKVRVVESSTNDGSARRAPFVARLNIRDAADRSVQADIGTNVDFLKGRLDDAKRAFREIKRYLETLTWLAWDREAEANDQQATLNQPEEA